jgi:hypothetical protein
MKGVYNVKGKFFARITHKKITVHLGSFDDITLAARTVDAANLMLARPVSAYNFPEEKCNPALLEKVVFVLRDKGVFGEEEIEKLRMRYMIIRSIVNEISD